MIIELVPLNVLIIATVLAAICTAIIALFNSEEVISIKYLLGYLIGGILANVVFYPFWYNEQVGGFNLLIAAFIALFAPSLLPTLVKHRTRIAQMITSYLLSVAVEKSKDAASVIDKIEVLRNNTAPNKRDTDDSDGKGVD